MHNRHCIAYCERNIRLIRFKRFAIDPRLNKVSIDIRYIVFRRYIHGSLSILLVVVVLRVASVMSPPILHNNSTQRLVQFTESHRYHDNLAVPREFGGHPEHQIKSDFSRSPLRHSTFSGYRKEIYLAEPGAYS
jgi:hypothetical protein